MKVTAIHDRTDVEPTRNKGGVSLLLAGGIGRAKRHVMHRAQPAAAARQGRSGQQINIGTGSAVTDGVARAVPFAGEKTVAHVLREHGGGPFLHADRQGHTVKTAETFSRRHLRMGRGNARIGFGRCHEFERESVGVGEGQYFLAEPGEGGVGGHTLRLQSFAPESQRSRRHGPGDGTRQSRAGPSARQFIPQKEGQQRAGRRGVISVIEMIGAGIVEVDGLLHEAQAEHPRVEVDVALRIRRDGGDVMKAREAHAAKETRKRQKSRR